MTVSRKVKQSRIKAYSVLILCKYDNKPQSVSSLYEEAKDSYKTKRINERDFRSCFRINNSVFEERFDDWKIRDEIYENLDVEWIKEGKKPIHKVLEEINKAVEKVNA